MQVAFQYPQQLTLALFNGEPTYPLTLLRSQRLNLGRWDVHFHIIGESHAVIISYEREPIFSEMLACIAVTADRCAYAHAFGELATHTVQRGAYSGQVMFDPSTPPPPLPHALTVTFPAVHGQVPMTRVTWQHDNGCLQWQTLHTYPLPATVTHVYTASHFDFHYYEGKL